VDVVQARQQSFPARGSSLGAVRGFVQRCAEDLRLPMADEQDVVLAASEAAANAIEHGVGPAVMVSCRPEGAWLAIEVESQGTFEAPPERDALDLTRGRGLHIILALVDEVTIRAGSQTHPTTLVRMRKHLDHGSARGPSLA
jgi:anti-sigma regulatory factor (Ser/Thr protein kinase)